MVEAVQFDELSFTEAIQSSENVADQLDRVIRDAPFGVYVDRPDAGCVYANLALLKQFGLRWEEFSGYRWATLVHPEDAEAFQAKIHSYELNPGLIDVRYRIIRQDGSIRWIHARVEARLDAMGRHVASVGTTEDITAAEERRNQTAEAQKLQVIGRLAGGVAHDFNNLMTAIMGSAELLRFEVKSSRGQQYLNTVDLALEQGRQVTEKLLMLARRRQGSAGVVGLDEQLQSLLPLLDKTLGAQLRIQLDLGAKDAHIPMDSGQLGQLVINLATNGADAMQGEGTLHIRTSVRESRAILEIEDAGCGMDAETQSWIFTPFFTTKDAEQGVGLGLSIVKDLVDLLAGSIEVQSQPDMGTRIRVDFPTVAMPRQPRPAEIGEDPRRFHRSERLLLIEDHDGLRQSLAFGLAIYGYSVQTARTIADAEDCFARDGFDVVVCDVLLPDGIGSELGRTLRTTRPDLPIVYISGFTGEAQIDTELQNPLTRFLPKPFSPSDLVITLSELLDTLD